MALGFGFGSKGPSTQHLYTWEFSTSTCSTICLKYLCQNLQKVDPYSWLGSPFAEGYSPRSLFRKVSENDPSHQIVRSSLQFRAFVVKLWS